MSIFTPVANPFGLNDFDFAQRLLGESGVSVELNSRRTTSKESNG
jgi:hypothetical protein